MQLLWILNVLELVMQRSLQPQAIFQAEEHQLSVALRAQRRPQGLHQKPGLLLNQRRRDQSRAQWDVAECIPARLQLITLIKRTALELLLSKLFPKVTIHFLLGIYAILFSWISSDYHF